MDTRNVDQVLWKYLTITDFGGMNGIWEGDDGGSAKHIPLWPSKRDEIAEFFDVAPFPPEDQDVVDEQINLEPVEGVPDSEGPIKVSCKLDRREGEWRIANQHNDRYVLWTPEHGFPAKNELPVEDEDDYYDSNPPIIYFVKDEQGNFHARSVNDSSYESLEEYPAELVQYWENAGKSNSFGIIDFHEDSVKSL
ncbi:hypothetical protein [Halorussus sp. MSC15.2]|uniref:hypothetical protein n=1 Tax=Halorussus sp. MSC15.2 TaxID=2283638 RepID=UPI0013D4BB08|nr:hypothetical protein [Halorussus sp. MSC15.2]NEU56547.1 hypothetical protein [Halorussus sp. MSC15.2]